MGRLRIEEQSTGSPTPAEVDPVRHFQIVSSGETVSGAVTVPSVQAEKPQAPKAKPSAADVQSLDHWRKMAIQAGERLNYAETQLKDLRQAADDARARFSKYKDRLDKANERVNDLQVQLVRMSAERDELRSQLATQETLARKVHEYRQSLLTGPLWELFMELAVCPPSPAGEGDHR